MTSDLHRNPGGHYIEGFSMIHHKPYGEGVSPMERHTLQKASYTLKCDLDLAFPFSRYFVEIKDVLKCQSLLSLEEKIVKT